MTTRRQYQSGNVLFMIMIAIVLIAALTVAVTRSNQGANNMDREQTSLQAAKVISFALDLKRAVENMTREGKSETSISFASDDLTGYGTAGMAEQNEVFNIAGGGVAFTEVPTEINDGSQWEFYGYTAAPMVGDNDTPDLMLVLPNVKESFCNAYNKKAGYADDAIMPKDTGVCLHDTSKRFSGTFATGGDINTMDAGNFITPAPSACVRCGTTFNAYYVLLER